MEMYNEIIAIIAEVLEISSEDLNLKSSIGEVMNWDSIHQLMIITSIEERYKISFSEENLFEMVTVGDIVNETEKLIIK